MPDTPSARRDQKEQRRARKLEHNQATRDLRRRLGAPLLEDLPVQAVFHWGLDDQEQALIAARDAEPEPGFMMRLLTLCTMPRTNPGDDQLQYRRVNGPFTLIMTATDSKLPYGTLPRLLLAWLCSEAVQTQSRVIHLGRSWPTSSGSSESTTTAAAPAATAPVSAIRWTACSVPTCG